MNDLIDTNDLIGYNAKYSSNNTRYNYKKRKNPTIPLFDVAALASGFYIGYAEGKGLDVSPTVEYLTKYGPTAFAMILSPIHIKLTNKFLRRTSDKIISGMKNGSLDVKVGDGYKKFEYFSEKKQKEMLSNALDSKQNIESILSRQRYFKPTLIAGTRIAIETIIGYAAGRVYSQLN